MKQKKISTKVINFFKYFSFVIELVLIVLLITRSDFSSFTYEWHWLAVYAALLAICYVLYIKLRTEWVEQTLVEEKFKSSGLIHALPEGAMVLDEDNIIITVNESAAEALGREVLSLLNQEITQFVREDIGAHITNKFTGRVRFNEELDVEFVPIQSNVQKSRGTLLIFRTKQTAPPPSSAAGSDAGRDPAGDTTPLRDLATAMDTDNEKSTAWQAYYFWKTVGWETMQHRRHNAPPDTQGAEKTHVRDSVSLALKTLHHLLDVLAIEVRNTIDCPGAATRIGREDMHWIFVELLLNAVAGLEHKDDARITLSSEAGSDAITITILDNGCGVAREALAQLPDKGFRIRRDGILSKAGRGLGLYHIRRILDATGGNMWIESEPGRGTKISVVMPLENAS